MDREKVMLGLEKCTEHGFDCGVKGKECPYYDWKYNDSETGDCIDRLMLDALELLKAQEPRVMTLEEVKSLERDAVVWYEFNGVNKQRPRIVDQVYDRGIIFTDGGHWQFNADAYGKKFRLWTSRPTDEQRAAVKWDG